MRSPMVTWYDCSAHRRPVDGGDRSATKRRTTGPSTWVAHNNIGDWTVVDAAVLRGDFDPTDGAGPGRSCCPRRRVTPVLAMLHALADAGSMRETAVADHP